MQAQARLVTAGLAYFRLISRHIAEEGKSRTAPVKRLSACEASSTPLMRTCSGRIANITCRPQC